MAVRIPFDYFGGHLISLPVELNGTTRANFLLDTGIGLTVVSTSLADRLEWTATGETFAGRRMSGQVLRLPLVRIGSLRAGDFEVEDCVVGTFDLSAFRAEGRAPDGILSLTFFESAPVTVRYPSKEVLLPAAGESTPRPPTGRELPVKVVRDGPSTEMFLDMRLPSGGSASMEVDTGSDALILHERYMAELGVRPDSPEVQRFDRTDETGHRYVRYLARVTGDFAPFGGADFRLQNPNVIFQDIIHDGLVGQEFFRAFDVTFDVRRSRLSLARSSESRRLSFQPGESRRKKAP